MESPVKGVLLDITGVLYESGEGHGKVIEGSVAAVQRIKESGIPFRLVTNESTSSREKLLEKLLYHKFQLTVEDIFSPIPAAISYMKERSLQPHLLIGKEVESEFSEFTLNDPTCVVLGDAYKEFSFENMNNAFNVLMAMKDPVLISMGKGKYFKHGGELLLDVGSFAAALEYACDLQAVVIGKPSPDFFKVALKDMGISPSEAVMVGDDINSDVGGAQKCGMKGILVKTGKFTPANLNHPTVNPDFIADNLAHAVQHILGH